MKKLETPVNLDYMTWGTAGDNVVVIRRYGFEHILKCLAIENPTEDERQIIRDCLAAAAAILTNEKSREIKRKSNANFRKGA